MKLSERDWLRYSLIAAFAVFLAVCLNPSSAWIMRRTSAVLRGEFSALEETFASSQLLIRRELSAKFANFTRRESGGFESLERTANLMSKSDDPVSDGIFSRNGAGDLAAMFGKGNRQIPGQLRERLVKELDSAAEKAPDNMLFPLLAMFALEGASDTKRVNQYRKLAANRTSYTSYVQAEAERNWQTYLERHSYDGEAARIFAYYGIALPHLSLLRQVEQPQLKGAPRSDPRRVEWLGIAHRMYSDADTAIEILVAVTAMDIAIAVDPSTSNPIGPLDKRLPYLREQAAKFKDAHPVAVSMVDDLMKAKKGLNSGRVNPFETNPLGLPLTPAGIAAAVLLVVVAVAGLIRTFVERPKALEPTLNLAPYGIIAGFLLIRSGMQSFTEALLWTSVVLVAPAVLAVTIPHPRASVYVALGTCVLFLLGGPALGQIGDVWIISGLLLAMSFVPFLKHLILPGAVAALSFGLVVTSLAIQPNFGPLVAVGWLIVVSLPMQHLKTRPLAALIAGASILFIAGVAVQVSENETLRANTDLFAEEVKEMRRAINDS